MGKTHIDPYRSVFIDRNRSRFFLLPLTGERDKPTVSLFGNGGFIDFPFDISRLAVFDPADFGQKHFRAFGFDTLRKTEALSQSFLLEFGMSWLFPFFHSSEKVLKRSVEIFEALLKDLAVDFT